MWGHGPFSTHITSFLLDTSVFHPSRIYDSLVARFVLPHIMSISGDSSDDDHASLHHSSQRGYPGVSDDGRLRDIKAGDLDDSSLGLPHAHTESRSAVPLDSQPQDSSSKSSKNDQGGYYADQTYSPPYPHDPYRQDGGYYPSSPSPAGYPAYSPDRRIAFGPPGQGLPQADPRQKTSIACRYCFKRKVCNIMPTYTIMC